MIGKPMINRDIKLGYLFVEQKTYWSFGTVWHRLVLMFGCSMCGIVSRIGFKDTHATYLHLPAARNKQRQGKKHLLIFFAAWNKDSLKSPAKRMLPMLCRLDPIDWRLVLLFQPGCVTSIRHQVALAPSSHPDFADVQRSGGRMYTRIHGRMYTRTTCWIWSHVHADSSQLHANRRCAFFACKIQWKLKLVVYVLSPSAAMRGSWFKQAICAAMVATTREQQTSLI